MPAHESRSPPRCLQAEHSSFDSQARPGVRIHGATNLDFEAPLSFVGTSCSQAPKSSSLLLWTFPQSMGKTCSNPMTSSIPLTWTRLVVSA